jgi:hypothetical protein
MAPERTGEGRKEGDLKIQGGMQPGGWGRAKKWWECSIRGGDATLFWRLDANSGVSCVAQGFDFGLHVFFVGARGVRCWRDAGGACLFYAGCGGVNFGSTIALAEAAGSVFLSLGLHWTVCSVFPIRHIRFIHQIQKEACDIVKEITGIGRISFRTKSRPPCFPRDFASIAGDSTAEFRVLGSDVLDLLDGMDGERRGV